LQHISKLEYFDVPGRGFAIRVALKYGGITFEDKRIPFSEWPKLKPTTPYQAVPLLTVDGKVYAQSISILRYVAKFTGLYPTDDLLALEVDEICDASEEIGTMITNSLFLKGEEFKNKRLDLNNNVIPSWLGKIEKRLELFGSNDSVTGKGLSMADIKLCTEINWIKSGLLDHIDPSLVDKYPRISQIYKAVTSNTKLDFTTFGYGTKKEESTPTTSAPAIVGKWVDLPKDWTDNLQKNKKMEEIIPGRIWRLNGILLNKIQRNMTVYKMNNGKLLIWSAICQDTEGQKHLESLGEIGVIYAPNGQHTFDAPRFHARYPNAAVVTPNAQIATLKKEKKLDAVSSEKFFEDNTNLGIKLLSPVGIKSKGANGIGGEKVLEMDIGNGDKALAFCDIVNNSEEDKGIVLNFLLGKSLGVPRIIKWTGITDKQGYKEWLEAVSTSNLKAVTFGHGNPLTTDVPAQLKAVAKRLMD